MATNQNQTGVDEGVLAQMEDCMRNFFLDNQIELRAGVYQPPSLTEEEKNLQELCGFAIPDTDPRLYQRKPKTEKQIEEENLLMESAIDASKEHSMVMSSFTLPFGQGKRAEEPMTPYEEALSAFTVATQNGTVEEERERRSTKEKQDAVYDQYLARFRKKKLQMSSSVDIVNYNESLGLAISASLIFFTKQGLRPLTMKFHSSQYLHIVMNSQWNWPGYLLQGELKNKGYQSQGWEFSGSTIPVISPMRELNQQAHDRLISESVQVGLIVQKVLDRIDKLNSKPLSVTFSQSQIPSYSFTTQFTFLESVLYGKIFSDKWSMFGWNVKISYMHVKNFAQMDTQAVENTMILGSDPRTWSPGSGSQFTPGVLGDSTGVAAAENTAVGEVKQQEDQTENVVFVDQSVPSVGTTIKALNQIDPAPLAMTDQNWEIQNMLSKPIPLKVSAWNTTLGRYGTVDSWDVLQDIIPEDGPVDTLMSNYRYLHCDFEFEFQLNSTKFHQGALIAYAVPFRQLNGLSIVLDHQNATTAYSHVVLDASNANTAILKIPFVAPYTYFDMKRSATSLCTVYLYCLSPLSVVGQASQEVNITCFVRLINPKLHGFHVPKVTSFVRTLRQNIDDYGYRLMVPSRAQGLGDTIFNFAKMIPVVGEALTGIEQVIAPVEQLLGGVSGLFNLDRPNDPREPEVILPTAVHNMSVGKGTDQVPRLCLHAGSIAPAHPKLVLEQENSMHLQFHTNRWSLAKVVQWTTSAATDDKIFDLTFQSPLDFDSMASYVIRPMLYWRGELELRVQFICTAFHTGRVMLCFQPDDVPASFNNIQYAYTVVFDLKEGTTVDFTIPYFSHLPWSKTRLTKDYEFHTSTDATVVESPPDTKGRFSIIVLNRLMATDLVPPSIDLLIWQRMSEKSEYAIPIELDQYPNSYTVPPTAQVRDTLEVPSLAKEPAVNDPKTTPRTLQEASLIHFGEEHCRMKDLLRRYQLLYYFTIDGLEYPEEHILCSFPMSPWNPLPPQFKEETCKRLTYLEYYAQMFRFWKGSLKYRVVSTEQVVGTDGQRTNVPSFAILKAYYLPNARSNYPAQRIKSTGTAANFTRGLLNGQAFQIQCTQINNILSFEVPYYSQYNMALTHGPPTSEFSTGVILVTTNNNTQIPDTPSLHNNGVMSLDVYVAIGDDFQLFYPTSFFPQDKMANVPAKISDVMATLRIPANATIPPLDSDEEEEEEEEVRERSFTPPQPEVKRSVPLRRPVIQERVKFIPAIEPTTSKGPFKHMAQLSYEPALLRVVSPFFQNRAPSSIKEDFEQLDGFDFRRLPTQQQVTAQQSFLNAYKPEAQMFKNTRKTIDKLPNILDKASIALPKFEKAAKDHGDLMATIHSFIKSFKGGFEQISKNPGDTITFVHNRILDILLINQNPGMLTCWKALTSFFSDLGFSLGGALMSLFTKMWNCLIQVRSNRTQAADPPVTEEKAGEEVSGVCEAIAGFISAQFGKVIKVPKWVIKSASNTGFGFCIRNINGCFTLLGHIIKYTKEFLSWMCPSLYYPLQFAPFIKRLEGFCTKVNLFALPTEEQALYLDASRQRELDALVLESNNLKKEFLDHLTTEKDFSEKRSVPAVFNMARLCFVKCEELGRILKRIRDGNTMRQEPFVVYISGPPGVGKSNLNHRLCMLFAREEYWDLDGMRYTRNSSDAYWSGYSHQHIVVFDDFAQNTEAEDLNQYADLVSTAAYPLNMADVSEKGRYFTSEVILIASNCSYPATNQVREKAAIFRRRNVFVEMTLKEDKNITPGDTSTYDFVNYTHVNIKSRPKFELNCDVHAPVEKFDGTIQEFETMVIKEWRKHKARCKSHMEAQRAKEIAHHEFILNHRNQAQVGEEIVRFANVQDDELGPGESQVKFPPILLEEVPRSRYVREGSKTIERIKETIPATHEVWDYLTVTNGVFGRIGPDLVPADLNELITIIKLCDAHYFEIEHLNSEGEIKVKATFAAAYETIQEEEKKQPTKLTFFLRAVGIAAAILSAIFMVRGIFMKPKDPPEGEESNDTEVRPKKQRRNIAQVLIPSGSDNVRRAKANKRVVVKAKSKWVDVKKVAQMDDQNAADLIRNCFRRACTPIAYECNDGELRAAKMLNLKGRVYVLPWHYVASFEKYGVKRILMHRLGVWYWHPWDKELIKRVADRDLAIFESDVQIPAGKDLMQHIPGLKDLNSHVNNFTGELLVARNTSENDIEYHHQLLQKVKAVEEVEYFDPYDNLYAQLGVWEYHANTIAGDCGAPLIATSTKLRAKLLGIHVAGGGGCSKAWAVPLIREELEEFVSGKISLETDIPEAQLDPEAVLNFTPLSDRFTLYGAVCPKAATKIPHKSKIIPSPIFEQVYLHVKEPSVLSAKDPRLEVPVSPLAQAVDKYAEEAIPFDEDLLEEAIQDTKEQIGLCRSERATVTPLTVDQAINGIPELKYYDRMNMDSSEGYPFILRRPPGESNKKWMFSYDEETNKYEIRDTLLAAAVRKREALVLQGIVPTTIWTDCLKDEKRPIEKIKQGKTRLFSISPVDYSIACRQYFLDFCAMFANNRLKLPHAVGINMESYEADAMVRSLLANSSYFIDGDFGNFDGKIHNKVKMGALRIINHWYKTEGDYLHTTARRALFESVLHSDHLVLNCLYQCHNGIPSGITITSTITSNINILYIKTAWLEITGTDLEEMRKHVVFYVYGDDFWATVTGKWIKVFNRVTLCDFFTRHGIKFTAGDKNAEITPYSSLSGVQFLKRTFRKDTDLACWVAMLDINSITDDVNWIRNCGDEEEALRQNVDCAFRFLHAYGKVEFEKETRKINNALVENGIQPVLRSWYSLSCEMYTGNTETVRFSDNAIANFCSHSCAARVNSPLGKVL